MGKLTRKEKEALLDWAWFWSMRKPTMADLPMDEPNRVVKIFDETFDETGVTTSAILSEVGEAW